MDEKRARSAIDLHVNSRLNGVLFPEDLVETRSAERCKIRSNHNAQLIISFQRIGLFQPARHPSWLARAIPARQVSADKLGRIIDTTTGGSMAELVVLR